MWQYLLVAVAVGFVILVKVFAIKRRMNKQIDGFLNPEYFVKEMENQISSP